VIRFLVGGVGITPARSILRDAVQRGRTGRGGALLRQSRFELHAVHRGVRGDGDRGVKVVSIVEHPDETWPGPVGFITADLVRQHVDPVVGMFFTSGPPVMVTAMERVLDELGIPEERRMVERFGPA